MIYDEAKREFEVENERSSFNSKSVEFRFCDSTEYSPENEEVFIAQLHRRAVLLDERFQAAVRSVIRQHQVHSILEDHQEVERSSVDISTFHALEDGNNEAARSLDSPRIQLHSASFSRSRRVSSDRTPTSREYSRVEADRETCNVQNKTSTAALFETRHFVGRKEYGKECINSPPSGFCRTRSLEAAVPDFSRAYSAESANLGFSRACSAESAGPGFSRACSADGPIHGFSRACSAESAVPTGFSRACSAESAVLGFSRACSAGSAVPLFSRACSADSTGPGFSRAWKAKAKGDRHMYGRDLAGQHSACISASLGFPSHLHEDSTDKKPSDDVFCCSYADGDALIEVIPAPVKTISRMREKVHAFDVAT